MTQYVNQSPTPGPHLHPQPSRRDPTPRRRGGRRPGAGAPKGNINGLKHGLYSRQVAYVALLLAAVPEFRALFIALGRTKGHPQRATLSRAFADAARIVIQDPKLAGSIRRLAAERLQKALAQIQARDTNANIF